MSQSTLQESPKSWYKQYTCPSFEDLMALSVGKNRPPGNFSSMKELDLKFKKDLTSRVALIDIDKKKSYSVDFNIKGLALSSNGNFIAACNDQGTLRVFGLEEEISDFDCVVHELNPQTLLFLEDESAVISGTKSGHLFFFETRNQDSSYKLEIDPNCNKTSF